MTETATAPCDAPLIPIVLGVVGHRDLRPDDDTRVKLKDALTRVFQEFDKAYPNSPKILLSPLAPGADQLAAHAALNQGRHWTVRAPLPFEPALALQSTSFRFDHLKTANNPDGIDFAGQEQFREFLKHGRVDWFVVPLPSEVPAAGRTARRRGEDWFLSPSRPGGEEEPINWAEVVAVDETKSPEYAALRRACYANPGGYIVRHCHTLLALWDEGIATKPSGTAEIVRFQLGGISLTHYRGTRTSRSASTRTAVR